MQMRIQKLADSIGWKIEPQTDEECRMTLSMIEALEARTNTTIAVASSESAQASDSPDLDPDHNTDW
jgi:hypothetical protein